MTWTLALALVAGAVYLMATAAAPQDPTESLVPQSRATAIANAAIIVFR